jgi:hypothetical protein
MATIVDSDGTRVPRNPPKSTGVWPHQWEQAAEVHVRVPLKEGEGAKIDTAALAELVGGHLAAAGVSGADQAEAYLVARMA